MTTDTPVTNFSTTISASDSASDVSTNGWDTVYMTHFDILNSAILTDKTFPAKFDFTASVNTRSGTKTETIQGEWKSWQVVGGGGNILNMMCIVQSGKYEYSDSTGTYPPYMLAASQIEIQIQLQQIIDASLNLSDSSTSGGTASVLKADSTSPVNVLGNQSVVEGIPNEFIQADKPAVLAMFQSYFSQSEIIQSFTQVFHTMMLNEQLVDQPKDATNLQWLKPIKYDYAVGSSSNSYAFGVMCTTDEETYKAIEDQTIVPTQTIDLNAFTHLAPGGNAVFFISRSQFIKNILSPGIVRAIPDAEGSDFKIETSTGSITNIKPLRWGNFETETDKGETFKFSPLIDAGGINIDIVGEKIIVDISGSYIYPLDSLTSKYDSTVTINLHTDFTLKAKQRTSDGELVLVPSIPKITTSTQWDIPKAYRDEQQRLNTASCAGRHSGCIGCTGDRGWYP